MNNEHELQAGFGSPRLAVVGASASLAVVVFILAVDVVFLMRGQVGSIWFSAIPTLLILDMSLVGAVLAIRRPANVIGPILIGAGLLTALSFGAGYYENLDGFLAQGHLPFVVAAAWFGGLALVPAIALMVVFLPLVFPTGHLLGPRWRILVGLAIFSVSVGLLKSATAPGLLGMADSIVNPVQVPAPLLGWITAIGTITDLTAPPVFLIAMASIVIRFRSSRGVERQQLKWFLFVAAIAGVTLGFSIVSVGPVSDIAWAIGLVAMGCLPLAIGIAILRYRLYEIDRIVSRTVSYAAVTAVLVVVFASVSLVLEGLLASLAQANALAVAASTLLVFALFQPLRRRVQTGVDRRFNRGRFEADREIARFAGVIRDQVDVDRVEAALEETLERTVRPASATIWLRSEGTR